MTVQVFKVWVDRNDPPSPEDTEMELADLLSVGLADAVVTVEAQGKPDAD